MPLVKAQYEPYLKEYVARVLSITPITPAPKDKKSKEKGPPPSSSPSSSTSPASSSSSSSSSSSCSSSFSSPATHLVELEDTILYPEGGGQPFDQGVFLPVPSSSSSSAVPSPSSSDEASPVFVNAVRTVVTKEGEEERERVLHEVFVPPSASWFLSLLPSPSSSSSSSSSPSSSPSVLMRVEWTRRFDHMQHHSAQHLISAICMQWPSWRPANEEEAGEEERKEGKGAKEEEKEQGKSKEEAEGPIPTLSWWLSSFPQESYIDFQRSYPFSPSSLAALEARINAVIREGRAVAPRYFPSSDALFSDPAYHSAVARGLISKSEGSLSLVKGPLRIVEMEGVEWNACGGTHVRSTAEIQIVKITKQERGKGGRTLRLYFLAGERARLFFSLLCTVGRELSAVLSVPPEQLGEVARGLVEREKVKGKALKKLEEQLAAFEARELAEEARKKGEKMREEGGGGGGVLVCLHKEEMNINYMQSLLDIFAVSPLIAPSTSSPSSSASSSSSSSLSSSLSSLSLSGVSSVWLFLTCTENAQSAEGQFLLWGLSYASGEEEKGKVGKKLLEFGGEISKRMNGKGGGKGKYQGKCNEIKKRGEAIKYLEEAMKTI